jgi:hypothetical protein
MPLKPGLRQMGQSLFGVKFQLSSSSRKIGRMMRGFVCPHSHKRSRKAKTGTDPEKILAALQLVLSSASQEIGFRI